MSATTSIVKKYRIPFDDDTSKGRMHLIKDKLDALIYFYPDGMYNIFETHTDHINYIFNVLS